MAGWEECGRPRRSEVSSPLSSTEVLADLGPALIPGESRRLVPWSGRPLGPVGVGGFGEAERGELADGKRGQVLIELRAGDGAGQYDRCPGLGQGGGQGD